jgi:hypothetical protein
MHRDELMNPDLLSEALLLCCGVVILAVFVLVIVAGCMRPAILP